MTDSLILQAQHWLALDPDSETSAALKADLESNNIDALTEAFGGRLAFGTAGLRGKYGYGPARMNRLVIRQTAAGLARWIIESSSDARPSIVIGYDGRRLSDVFAGDTADIMRSAGIDVFLFDSVTTTPCCAWAVIQRQAAAGVMVTASHNPPDYNGFKVYAANGAQIIEPADDEIATQIAEIDASGHDPMTASAVEGPKGVLTMLGADDVQAYLSAVTDTQHERVARVPEDARTELNIVYSAMHGTGAHQTLSLLKANGFLNVHPVAAQNEPDGAFPTVNFPNPEDPVALALSIELAKAQDADIILANDPDADRLAVVVKHEGEWVPLNGDEIGALLAHDQLANSEASSPMVATTIVSSRMLRAIAADWNATCVETLTGFKWIANAAMTAKTESGANFLFGYEEAIGFTIGETVRDKDGVGAALAVAALAAQCADNGLTLIDQLDALRGEYGIYLTGQASFPTTRPLTAQLRAAPPERVAGQAVTAMHDLEQTNAEGPYAGLPASNVLVFELADQSRIIVRPSGTEPKVKMYLEVIERPESHDSLGDALDAARERLAKLKADAAALVSD
jgi:phosphomannomutase